jgi:hypothetical protein
VQPRTSRLLTLLAGSLLAFDGAALALLGWLSHRVLLILLGLICFVSAGLVAFYWRWYQRRLQDIAHMREGLRDEALELRRFLRNN